MSEPKFKVGDIVERKIFGIGKIVAITIKPFLSYLVYFPGTHEQGWQALWFEEYELKKARGLDIIPKISTGEILTRVHDREHSNVKPARRFFEGADIEEKQTQAPAAFIDFVCNKLDEVKELFRRKNQQYSVGADPLANFRAGALLRAGNDSYAEMYEEAKDYQRKHVVHIERNGIDADKGDESLDDIIVYSAIMAYMRYCYEQELSND